MTRVLIIGATGHIGSALSQSLLRTGHYTVYGLARTPSKARSLAQNEVSPLILADPVKNPAPLLDLISTAHIDIIVQCGADEGAAELLATIIQAGTARLERNRAAGAGSVKLGFVYTSGTWVHGSSRAPISDLDLVAQHDSPQQPPRLLTWRPGMEQKVLAARDVLDVMIVRPGLLYGREHPIWSLFMSPVCQAAHGSNAKSKVTIPLEKVARPGLIHVDDVASGLHAAVNKLPVLSGTGVYPVFDLTSQSEGMQDIFDAFAKAVGFKGTVELVGAGDDAFAEAMSTTANNSSARAKQILGWQPTRRPFVDGMDVYAKAFMATQE